MVFTVPAQRHALQRHPEDFPACLPHSGGVIARPLFAGDDFRNAGKIELISRIPALGRGLLVAVTLDERGSGVYHVCSMYPVSDRKIEDRLARGFLRRVVF